MVMVIVSKITKMPEGSILNSSLIYSKRSSGLQMFFKIGFLKNFAILTGKHPY